MNSWEEVNKHCPYCGESITLLIDCSEAVQNYVEDCEVCCRPMIVDVSISLTNDLQVIVHDENSVY